MVTRGHSSDGLTTTSPPRPTSRLSRQGAALPPADDDPRVQWPLAAIASRCPDEDVAAPGRIDPFWDGIWGSSSKSAWMPANIIDTQIEAGLCRLPKKVQFDRESARRRLLQPRGWVERLRLLAALDMWRTTSAEQAASITGNALVLDHQSSVVSTLFRSGLIDVGVLDSPARRSRMPTRRSTVLRPSRTREFEQWLAPHLTWPEWVSITGGQPWSYASQFDRHNLLATEFGLRLLEYADVGTVLGEKFSSIELLAASGLGRDLRRADNRSADVTLIRPDGMRIAVEITATTTGRFRTKVERWAQLLADLPLEQSGLMVLFVAADPIERHDARGMNQRNSAATIIHQMCRRYPGSVGNRIASRIGIVSWPEMFPARHQASEHFFDLRCLTPSGPVGDVWQEARWLDPEQTPFEPRDRSMFTAAIDNAQNLAGIPWWARDTARAVPMWQVMLAERGRDAFPMPDSARPERVRGKTLGAGVGAAGDAQPPVRLLGL